MSGVKDRPGLVVESPLGPTWGETGNLSPMPTSGTKGQPSLVDDFPAMLNVNNLGSGERVLWREVQQPSKKNVSVSPPLHSLWRSSNDGHLPIWEGLQGL